MLPALALTLVAWTLTTITFAAGAQAVGIELTWSQAILLAAGVNLVTAIPSGPGFVGTWELAAVRILALFGVSSDTAFAFALLVHVSGLAATTLIGAGSFVRIGWLPRAPKAAPGAVVQGD
jgi:glycosyltransferase 2 family protein